MDFLNLVLAAYDRLGAEIPEADYSRLSTLDGAVAHWRPDYRARRQQTS